MMLLGLLGNAGNVPAIVSDRQIVDSLESLFRAAALRTVREVRAGVSGLSQAYNEYQFDRELERDIYDKGMEALAGVTDLRPMSHAEFKRALADELSGLGGFFSQLKRSVKKVVTAPVRLQQKIFRSVKRAAVRHKDKLKKAAMVAAAGAAVWYGGPYVIKGIKNVAGPLFAQKAAAAGGMMGPPPPEGYGDPMGPPAPPGWTEIASSPAVVDGATNVMQASLANQGLQMQSPGAMELLTGMAKGALVKLKNKMQAMGPPEGPPATPGWAAGPGMGPPAPPNYRPPASQGGLLPLVAAATGAYFLFRG